MRYLVLVSVLIVACGCAITTPKGVYSLALTGDQVGFAKDVVAQVGNLYQEIQAQEAALEEAQKQGKTDRVASILEKIASLKQKAEAKEAVVEEEIEAAQEVLEGAK